MDLYEILGVSKDATDEELKVAYRKKAKKHHPDVGGDVSTMQNVSHAYAVLSDSERRKTYDECGEHDEKDPDTGFRQMFLDILDKAAKKYGPPKLKKGFQEVALEVRKAIDKQIGIAKKDLEGCRRSLERVGKGKDFGTTVLRNLLDGHARDCERAISKMQVDLVTLAKVVEAGDIMEYRDDVDDDRNDLARQVYKMMEGRAGGSGSFRWSSTSTNS